jgi:hypothetical protein
MAPTTHIKKNAMGFGQALLCAAAIVASIGCRENPLVPDGNILPTANAGPDQMLDYAGSPVTVMLNGSASTDDDGVIQTYRWLSGDLAPDGGVGDRAVPAGAPANWPDDGMNPSVVLDQGRYRFSLWVTDDEGATSEPDTVEISVGSDPVQECIAGVVPAVATACTTCMCGLDDMCRAQVVETACDATCWALIQCIGANCPDFAAMAAMADYSCLMANCMAQFTASQGGATPAGATPAGACARRCPTECAAAM